MRHRFSRVKALNDAIDVLTERGYVTVESAVVVGPGRPKSPLVRVRRELVEGWR